MKYLFVAALVCMSIAQTYGITCFTGRTDTRGDGTRTGFFNSTDCMDKYCQTRIELNQNNLIVEKSCKERQPCRKEVLNNERDCYSGLRIIRSSRVCRYCCDSDDCNTATEIVNPPPPLDGNN